MQLPANATLANAPQLLQALQQALATDNGPLRIDASELAQFDTSVLAFLMQALRLARAAERGFELVGAPPKLAQLARLYGVAALLSLPESDEPTATTSVAASVAPSVAA